VSSDPRLEISLCGITLKNPVLAASGTFAYGSGIREPGRPQRAWGLVVKGLSARAYGREPAAANLEAEAGMINSIGLQNTPVSRAFVREKLPALARLQTAVFANIFGSATEDYSKWFARWKGGGLPAYELNVSCPNTRHGGIHFRAITALAIAEVVTAVRSRCVARRPVIVKAVAECGPHRTVHAPRRSGADAISLVDTFVPRGGRRTRRRPRIGAGFGGLSGPAIKPIALRLVYEAAQAVRIPVDRVRRHRQRRGCGRVPDRGLDCGEVGTATFWTRPRRCALPMNGEFLRQEKGSERAKS